MSRRIIETKLQASNSATEVDSYFEKIMKYIPSEIVGAWIAIQGIAESTNNQNPIFLWGIIIFLAILTFFYIKKRTDEENKKTALKQTIISVIAFAIWAFAIGGEPFESLSFYNSGLGSILLIIYTVTIPVIPLNHD
ncbi:MAG: hypothetical protein F6K40_24060 [Okeania sp. SIO3I5]|uniref:hypothetical protein n=1 Tax=Okeania sp. SIO3I5 TaxID=2607805 RepID=UPI0013BCF2BF|nr:hypothetical protein [Okeania sp. SIO3I5]NEQ39160.1 hypothetical protein [Okeania sp. SIO3I5]